MSFIGGRVEREPLPLWLKCCRGRRMEAQWSPQWSPNGRYWSAKGGTVMVQGSQKHRSNWYTMFKTVRIILRGEQWPTPVHPSCNHGHACAFLLPPLSDFVRLFWTCSKLHGDHGVHGDVGTSSGPPLNDQGNLSTSFVPSVATWTVLWSHNGGTKVAARV